MSISDIKRSKHGSILLDAIDVADCKLLFSGAKKRSYDAGQTIFSEGDPGTMLMLIETGRVEVSVTSIAGRKSVLAHMGPGEVLGEIAALDGGPRSADTVAAGKVSGLVLSRQNILKFVAERPKVAQAIISELCRKVRNASDMFTAQSETEGAARLARAVLRLIDKWGIEVENGAFELREKFSQGELGEFSGLARENVNRHLKSWAESGIIQIEKRQLTVLDRDALEDLLDT